MNYKKNNEKPTIKNHNGHSGQTIAKKEEKKENSLWLWWNDHETYKRIHLGTCGKKKIEKEIYIILDKAIRPNLIFEEINKIVLKYV
jgi:hypothetical protein